MSLHVGYSILSRLKEVAKTSESTMGQDNTEDFNTIDIETENKTLCTEGTYTNKNIDRKHYEAGKKITIKYAFDPLKKPKPNGDIDYSKIVVEILISE
ncbi:hypothetical protein [Pseudomonas aeruginosa]